MVFSASLSICLGSRCCCRLGLPLPFPQLSPLSSRIHASLSLLPSLSSVHPSASFHTRSPHTHTSLERIHPLTHHFPHTHTHLPSLRRQVSPDIAKNLPLRPFTASSSSLLTTYTSSQSLPSHSVHTFPFCSCDTAIAYAFSHRILYHPFIMGKGPKKKHHKHRSEHCAAASHVAYWASCGKQSELLFSAMDSSTPLRDWIPSDAFTLSNKPLVIDLHTHSTCSDGMLTPVQLVEKAAASGVQVLALTDHDTMAGIPAALEMANHFGIRLIPGVEISAKVTAKTKNSFEEPVHILGYYSCCGPSRWQELESTLARIREGRHKRAQSIIGKLKSLKKPITWESVTMLAGAGVAPGRMHIARALLEAGHVYSLREAFNKYLYDGGPAYAPGCELAAEDAVRLISDTGGVAVLAHPWSLKDALPVVKRLKEVGLQAMEVYRGDGRANGFAALAETYELLKLGGSDFHGRGEPDETKLGQVSLPTLAIHKFLQVAEPVWRCALKEILQNFADENFEVSADKVVTGMKYFTGLNSLKGDLVVDYCVEREQHRAALKLSPWLTKEDREVVHEAVTQLKLTIETVVVEGRTTCIVSRQIN